MCEAQSQHLFSSLGRSLCAKELWNCQGLFQTAFDNPAAFDDIMKNQAQAQDLAGQGLMRCFSNMYIYIYCSYIYVNIYIYTQTLPGYIHACTVYANCLFDSFH